MRSYGTPSSSSFAASSCLASLRTLLMSHWSSWPVNNGSNSHSQAPSSGQKRVEFEFPTELTLPPGPKKFHRMRIVDAILLCSRSRILARRPLFPMSTPMVLTSRLLFQTRQWLAHGADLAQGVGDVFRHSFSLAVLMSANVCHPSFFSPAGWDGVGRLLSPKSSPPSSGWSTQRW